MPEVFAPTKLTIKEGESPAPLEIRALPSVVIEGWVGLAMLAGGRRRIGERLIAASPVHGERVEVEVITPHWLDAENARVKG